MSELEAKSTSIPRQPYAAQTHDLWFMALMALFALLSVIWPQTGRLEIFGLGVPRGYLVALVMLASGFFIGLLGLWDFSKAPIFVRMLRCCYPIAYFGPLFLESIILSSQPWGGILRDGLLEAWDSLIFHCQPTLELSRIFGSIPLCNDLMFGAYFFFYFMLIVTPLIPLFRGDYRESERESSILVGYMLVVFIFYVFFRVEGPKHWIPELVKSGYAAFKGGIITSSVGSLVSHAVTTGAAFPSSHVAVAVMMTIFVSKTAPKLLYAYIPATILIMLATVYIHAHWATDVLGGVAAAVIFVPMFGALWQRKRQPEEKAEQAYVS